MLFVIIGYVPLNLLQVVATQVSTDEDQKCGKNGLQFFKGKYNSFIW